VDAPQGLAARHRFTVTAGVAHRRVLVPPRRSDEQGSTAGQAGGSVA
jgi:hypothetical protein